MPCRTPLPPHRQNAATASPHLCRVVVLALAALLKQVLQPAPPHAAVNKHQILKGGPSGGDQVKKGQGGGGGQRETHVKQGGFTKQSSPAIRPACPSSLLPRCLKTGVLPPPHTHRSSGAGSVSRRRAIYGYARAISLYWGSAVSARPSSTVRERRMSA